MRIFRNQRGFSLVEVMVAAGMLGVVSLGVSHVMQNMGKTQRWMETKNEETSLVTRLGYELRDQQVCTHTLVGVCTDSTGRPGRFTTQQACIDATANNTPGAPFTWTPRGQALGNVPTVFGRSNTAIFFPSDATRNKYGNGAGQVELTSITFMADPANPPVAGRQGTAILRALITRNDKTAKTTSKTTATDISITVKWLTTTTISECYADREDTIQTAKMQACQNLGGTFHLAGGAITEDWCELHNLGTNIPDGTFVDGGGTPGVRQNDPAVDRSSRAVEQSYVDDMFRRSCLGPGRIYRPGNYTTGLPPSCEVDVNRLRTACGQGEYLQSISFGEGGGDAPGTRTKFPSTGVADGDTLQYTCRPYCNSFAVGFFVGFDPGTNLPICFNCSNGEIPVYANSKWTCKNSVGQCPNDTVVISGVTYTQIKAFDGWNANGTASCKVVSKLPQTACSGTGNVLIGFTTDTAGKVAPNCCQKGSTCPAQSSVCANGYLAEVDSCGFKCPGTKQQTKVESAQPLVYGCEYSTDTNQYTRRFVDWTCGTPETEVSTQTLVRACRLGGDKANKTYQDCRNAGGIVAFFSKAIDPVTGGDMLLAGKEEDSYCLLPQRDDSSTYGRESNNLVNNCNNCNLTVINLNNVRTARNCATYGWKQAKSTYSGNIIYQVGGSYCGAYGMKTSGGSCVKYGPSRSYSFTSRLYEAAPGADAAYWPNTYISGVPDMSEHKSTPPTNSTDHWDSANKTSDSCPYDNSSVVRWQSFKCWSRVAGMSCK